MSQKVASTTHTHLSADVLDFDASVAAAPTVTANTAHVANMSNPHTTTKSDVGLSNVPNLKQNLSATLEPTVSDDTTQGYAVGSAWYIPVQSRAFLCTNASVAAALWPEISFGKQVFAAYDDIGDILLNFGFAAIPWKKTHHIDASTFSLANNSTEVVIANFTGLVRVTSDVTTYVSNNRRSCCVSRLMVSDGSSGFIEHRGTRASQYNRLTSAGRNTASFTTSVAVKPGYKLKVEASRDQGSGNVYTRADGCRILIETVKKIPP